MHGFLIDSGVFRALPWWIFYPILFKTTRCELISRPYIDFVPGIEEDLDALCTYQLGNAAAYAGRDLGGVEKNVLQVSRKALVELGLFALLYG